MMVVAAALALTFAVFNGVDDDTVPQRVEATARDTEIERISDRDLRDFGTDRASYRYSIIPGGAYNTLELQSAIEKDPIVASHYVHVDPARVRVETVARDRLVHVSYRKGNQIFWAKSKVLLRQGETILTDGTTQIRAKCGNCISEQPLLPTSPAEPDAVEFDRLAETDPAEIDPTSQAAALLVPPDAVAPSAVAGAPGLSAPADEFAGLLDPLAGGLFDSAPTPLAGLHGVPFGEDWNPPADVPVPLVPNPGRTPLPVPAPGIDLPPITTPPAPGTGQPLVPIDELFPGSPGLPVSPGYTNPAPPTLPPAGSPSSPPDPVSVPEPGTWLLVGGSAALLIRRLRARAQ